MKEGGGGKEGKRNIKRKQWQGKAMFLSVILSDFPETLPLFCNVFGFSFMNEWSSCLYIQTMNIARKICDQHAKYNQQQDSFSLLRLRVQEEAAEQL